MYTICLSCNLLSARHESVIHSYHCVLLLSFMMFQEFGVFAVIALRLWWKRSNNSIQLRVMERAIVQAF